MNRIIKSYLKRLTNLSTRNKSLLLTGLPSEQFLDIHQLDFLLGKSSSSLIKQLIQRKSRIPLCDVQDPRFDRVNEASKRLRKITRTVKFIEEERGTRDLYLGFPFVRGKLNDGTTIHAPLLFFPVDLFMDREQWCIAERDDARIVLNRSFSLAYSHFNEVEISDATLETSFEDFPKEVLEFKTALYEWLKTSGFRINFNQEVFEETIVQFDAQKSSELDRIEKNGELKLFSEAVLGVFPQSGSFLMPDYNTILNRYNQEPFPIQLLNSVEEEKKEKVYEEFSFQENQIWNIKEEDVLTPFSIDESQEEIVKSVKSGNSVVVQGPPGSGKSQLICNLMADFASKGKKVLLVCQKRAALDVVYHRLKTIGMDPFVGLIHDFTTDRTDLYKQIASQIDHVEQYRQENYSLDAVFVDRQFGQESRQIDQIVKSLDGFRVALCDETACGVSIKELYLNSDPNKPSIDLGKVYRSFSVNVWDDFKRKLSVYTKYNSLIHPHHEWKLRKSFAHFDLHTLKKMERMLLEWPQAYAYQCEQFDKITGIPYLKHFIEQRSETVERLEDIISVIKNEDVYQLFKQYMASQDDVYQRKAYIHQSNEAIKGIFNESDIELTLKAAELPAFKMKLAKAIESNKSKFSGFVWRVFDADKKILTEVVQRNSLQLTSSDLAILDIRLQNRMQLESLLESPFLSFNEVFLDSTLPLKEQYLDFFQNAEDAADAVSRMNFEPWKKVIQYLAKEGIRAHDFKDKLSKLIDWLKSWDRIEAAMNPYLLSQQIEDIIDQPHAYSERLLLTLRQDFDSLVDMDQIWSQMSSVEQELIDLIIDFGHKTGLNSPDDLVNIFDNSIKLAWIQHIETQYPVLRSVTSLKMGEWEDQLQKSITNKQNLSSDIVGINLREKVYQDVEKNRLGNRVTYRELYHQVTKKRSIWPIRKLLETHREEVFTLIPCWMVSPESASAIFPMQSNLFDLVIFDEASQCYAEYGLPAAFRGKQVVVAGDSKQLPPSDLYKVRFDEKLEDADAPIALEVESLLDLAAQTLDQYQLRGHYRSKSLDLIDFSNHYFYKNSLKLLPDFHEINLKESGIEYVKVNGIWEHNSNAVEVAKVLELIKNLTDTSKSVGVVTFNFNQQQAIQDALDKENISAKDLFVKNIENVQGDERDVIIFTMGYAPDNHGKLAMHFGSLNVKGGENRLNVAITRAKEKIYFVTSLMPSQLQTDSTANPGPKLLKLYLQYALNVWEGKYQPQKSISKKYKVDWLLKEKLLKKYANLTNELPFCDLVVQNSGKYTAAILTDDDLYQSSKSAKEPHAYLPLLLKSKNWPVNRLFSRAYWQGSLNIN